MGSRYWLKHPTVPAERVKLALTIDMVGRLRKNSSTCSARAAATACGG